MNTELARSFLADVQNADGGWGYGAPGASSTEPTAAALLALRNLPDSPAVSRGSIWLQHAQHEDGGWGLTADDSESNWHTTWGLLAQARHDLQSESVTRAATWLLGMKRIEVVTEGPVLDEARFGMDLSLRGWPWRSDEATWVEPTAWALLALANAETSPGEPRMEEGVRYLLDRRCDAGGWNVGNPRMFSQALPARAVPSAWVILALARLDRAAVTPADLSALRNDAAQDGGPCALAWALLALRNLGQDDVELARQLASQQGADGSWEASPYYTAVALLAERGEI